MIPITHIKYFENRKKPDSKHFTLFIPFIDILELAKLRNKEEINGCKGLRAREVFTIKG